jgi:hypothetical protein
MGSLLALIKGNDKQRRSKMKKFLIAAALLAALSTANAQEYGPNPLGWVYGPYLVATSPDTAYVSVDADGVNVRADNQIIATLANGVPVAILGQYGPWVLIAPLCPLQPTWTYSITAGGLPLSVCSSGQGG